MAHRSSFSDRSFEALMAPRRGQVLPPARKDEPEKPDPMREMMAAAFAQIMANSTLQSQQLEKVGLTEDAKASAQARELLEAVSENITEQIAGAMEELNNLRGQMAENIQAIVAALEVERGALIQAQDRLGIELERRGQPPAPVDLSVTNNALAALQKQVGQLAARAPAAMPIPIARGPETMEFDVQRTGDGLIHKVVARVN